MKNIVVIKFGGEIVEDKNQLENLASSVSMLCNSNFSPVLIHGGGPMATRLSEKLQIVPRMVGGRRVTCDDTLEVMKKVLPGIINTNILAILKSKQLNATSVSGVSIVECHKRAPKIITGSNGETIDFGHVGDVDSISTHLLELLIEKNYIPVISPLSADSNGFVLNINADTIAAEVAISLQAKHILMITAIGGVYLDINKKETLLHKLPVIEAKRLIKDNIITGGMIPKLEEGFKLIDSGIKHYHIVNTDDKKNIFEEIKNPGSIGTCIY
jgi:acetylglutamate kinase